MSQASDRYVVTDLEIDQGGWPVYDSKNAVLKQDFKCGATDWC